MNQERRFYNKLDSRLDRRLVESFQGSYKLYCDQLCAPHSDFLQKTRTLDLKILKQTAENKNASFSRLKTRRKLLRKVFERIKESKWATPCKSM